MYATGGGGGGRGFFFSAARFLYPPPRSIQIFRTPQAISRKINTPPPPSPLPRNIKINICIIVNYICLKSQETCLIRTSREHEEVHVDPFQTGTENSLNI